MNRPLVWSLAALAVTGALALSLHELNARTDRPAPAVTALKTRPADPVLARCRAAGEAAGGDVACQAAWRSARARFFGRIPQ